MSNITPENFPTTETVNRCLQATNPAGNSPRNAVVEVKLG